jgi:hypothetical protein
MAYWRPYMPGEEGLQDQRIIEATFENAQSDRPLKLAAPAGLDPFRGSPPELR